MNGAEGRTKKKKTQKEKSYVGGQRSKVKGRRMTRQQNRFSIYIHYCPLQFTLRYILEESIELHGIIKRGPEDDGARELNGHRVK